MLEPLGAGGMGEVYRARDTRLAREVALKRLSDPALTNDIARSRVMREARAAAALSHPGIATVYDVLETPQGLIIVMEYVPGDTLAARLQRGPMSLDQTLDVGIQIADALTHAHEHGIVHRDLKPANVHLTPAGRAKILDFGIAKSASDHAAADPAGEFETGSGRIIGSPGYMAPEQLAGSPSDQRTDVYGAGVLLFEMLTGRRPFPAVDPLGSALAMFSGPAPRVEDDAPHVPAQVSAVVARAMARVPGDRFPTAASLSRALQQARHALNEAETGVSIVDAAPPPRSAWSRHRAVLTVAGALLVLAAGLVLVWTQVQPSPVSAHSSVVGVLPFRNQSGNSANDPLVTGLSDAVVKRLASVRTLRVLPLEETREARRTVSDAAGVARTLGAGFVVDGTLQRTGQTVDVTVFLVGDDGQRRPAGRFSGDVDRLFELHRRVAEGLTATLRQAGADLGGAAPEAAPPTANQEAYADYAQARVFLERPDVPGSLDHAIRLLQGAIGKDARFAIAYAALGEAYWAQYRETNDPAWTVKAQAANLDALRIDPAQPEVHIALAVMYEGVGRPAEATDELRQALALQPRSDNAHLVLSRIRASKGDWDGAIAEAKAALELRPTYWRNHAQLGDACMRAGRLEEAIAAYRRLVELQPDSARAYQRLGTVLQAAGRNDEALESYEKAKAINPTWGTYSNIGTLYYWRGDTAQAIDAYQRAIALAPKNPDLYANLGDALQKSGQPERAAENYRRAVQELTALLAINKDDPINLAALAMSEAKLGNRTAAATAIRRAIALSPKDGEVLYTQAVVHALNGETAAACTAITDALAHGRSAEETRRSDELKTVKGCPAYDAIMAPAK